MSENGEAVPSHFIRDAIVQDIEAKSLKKIITRFPPEPNGFLHIGHAKAVNISFSMAEEFKGEFHLRFDDTNPSKEEQKYIDSILEDVKWLGYDWGEHLYYASDYFDRMYELALVLIKKGLAYVDDQDSETIRANRGTLTEAGKDSPFRDRSPDENLKIFTEMKEGKHPDGSRVLRAKIDMASPNMNMRDPVMYRILKASHHRQGDKWNIYPMYDWAHGLEDSIENITHSLCSLEFEDHRPLYDWFLEQAEVYHPRQIEFARLNMNYTVLSKRKLKILVDERHVTGWDDPRLLTIAGLRRRGYTSRAIAEFLKRTGVAKADSTSDIALLEFCIREDLNEHAKRVMAVLKPLKVIVTNYPEDKEEEFDSSYHPEDDRYGSRKLPFSREIYIEEDDFMEDPPRKFFRLGPGREIRLKNAYYIKCEDFKKDKNGKVTEVYCTYDPDTHGGWSKDGRKVKGTSHWVSAKHAFKAEIRLYDRLFKEENPEAGTDDFTTNINPESVTLLKDCLMEPSLRDAKPGESLQFERIGYFCADSVDSRDGEPVFNRIVGLRDSWAKKAK